MAALHLVWSFSAGVAVGATVLSFMVRRRLRRMIRDGEI